MKIVNLVANLLPLLPVDTEIIGESTDFTEILKGELEDAFSLKEKVGFTLDEADEESSTEIKEIASILQSIVYYLQNTEEVLDEQQTQFIKEEIPLLISTLPLSQLKQKSSEDITQKLQQMIEQIKTHDGVKEELIESIQTLLKKMMPTDQLEGSTQQKKDLVFLKDNYFTQKYPKEPQTKSIDHYSLIEKNQRITPLANNSIFYGKLAPKMEVLAHGEKNEPNFEHPSIDLNLQPKIQTSQQAVSQPVTNQNLETNLTNVVKTISSELTNNFKVLTRGEVTTSQLKLYPEELGEVNVQMQLIKGQLNVRIIASTDQAFSFFNENGKELYQRFENTGFDEINVEFLMEENSSGEKEGNNFTNFFKKGNKTNGNLSNEEEEEYLDLVKSAYNYKV